MSDADALKAEIKKLSSKATTAKMDLHDLAEDLPGLKRVAVARPSLNERCELVL